MGILGEAKKWINRGLAPLNMRLESLTAERVEARRLSELVASGHFDRPVVPVLRQFQQCDPSLIMETVKKFEAKFQKFESGADTIGFRFQNSYYQSPDAEVLYAIARIYQPSRIVEIGAGNSTLLFRHAIVDGSLACQLTSIDPFPRRDILGYSDEVIRCRLENLPDKSLFGRLKANDILFIDSSHEIKVGNDVLALFLEVIPSLASGVIIHIHDVFLPYDYPEKWVVEYRWSMAEQYLLQALLQQSDAFEVLWCGYYLQKSRPGLLNSFKYWTGGDAQSLWLRKR